VKVRFVTKGVIAAGGMQSGDAIAVQVGLGGHDWWVGVNGIFGRIGAHRLDASAADAMQKEETMMAEV